MVLDKPDMTEEDVKLQHITPAILAKCDCGYVTMETKITDGRINLKGNFVVRGKPKKADYVLYLEKDKPIAIVEAKDNNSEIMEKLEGSVSRENTRELLGDKLPLGAVKVSVKEK